MQVRYSANDDAMRLFYDCPADGSYPVDDQWNIVADISEEDDRKVVGLELLNYVPYLPLGKQGYCLETDTLTVGSKSGASMQVTEYGDFVAHWSLDEVGCTKLDAVDLRNASKHMSPVIAASRRYAKASKP